MTTYTSLDAQQNITAVLERAKAEGKVMIRHDGVLFYVAPIEEKLPSPLDVPSVDMGIPMSEWVELLQHERVRTVG